MALQGCCFSFVPEDKTRRTVSCATALPAPNANPWVIVWPNDGEVFGVETVRVEECVLGCELGGGGVRRLWILSMIHSLTIFFFYKNVLCFFREELYIMHFPIELQKHILSFLRKTDGEPEFEIHNKGRCIVAKCNGGRCKRKVSYTKTLACPTHNVGIPELFATTGYTK